MFRQLMLGQTEQAKATAALEERITSDFANMKTDMNDNNRRLGDRMDTMASGFDSRIEILEKELQRVAAVQAHGPACVTPNPEMGDTSPRPAEHEPRPFRSSSSSRRATSNPDPNENKVVLGGWKNPQRKNIVEDRVRELLSSMNIQVQDIFARKRGQVAFIHFFSMDTLTLFVNRVRQEGPMTNTEGDNKTIWAKRSVPPEERERTKAIRCAARAFYGLWDTTTLADRTIPDEFLVDYWRQEVVMGDSVLAHVIENKIFWHEVELRAALPMINIENLKTKAAEYMSGPGI